MIDVVTLDPNFKFDQSRVSPLKNPKFKSISAISCLGSDERLVCGSSEGRLTCWALDTMTLLTYVCMRYHVLYVAYLQTSPCMIQSSQLFARKTSLLLLVVEDFGFLMKF